MQNPYSRYRQSQIETTPKLKLIVMLHDGAIRFLQQSIPEMVNQNYEQKGKMINKTISILAHLIGTLDYERGGELAINLRLTNLYLTRRLVEANFQNDPAIVNEVILHLRGLREAWNVVATGKETDLSASTQSTLNKLSDLSLAA